MRQRRLALVAWTKFSTPQSIEQVAGKDEEEEEKNEEALLFAYFASGGGFCLEVKSLSVFLKEDLPVKIYRGVCFFGDVNNNFSPSKMAFIFQSRYL